MTDEKNDLILITCSQSKEGITRLIREPRGIRDFISAEAYNLLEEGRQRALARSRPTVDKSSPFVPALDRYTGEMYKVPEFKKRILDALSAGIHCLIISGGYGLLRPEELIYVYNVQIGSTASIWRHRIPAVLSDYVNQHGIRRVFVACSQNYARVVKTWICPLGVTNVYWYVPKAPARQRARKEVPRRIGEVVVSLIAAKMSPDERWRENKS